MDTALCVLLLCAVLASHAEYCANPLDRCVSPEVCAVAYPDEFSDMPICGPKRDGRCCPMLSRCPRGCGNRHQPAIFRSLNPESALKYINTSPAPSGSLEGTNDTIRPMAMPGIPEISMSQGETPKLYRSADYNSKEAQKEEIEIASDTIKPEKAQKEHFAAFETFENETGRSTNLPSATDRTNESEAPLRIAKRDLNAVAPVDFQRKPRPNLKAGRDETGVHKKVNASSTIPNRKFMGKRRRGNRRRTTPLTTSDNNRLEHHRRFPASTALDNLEMVTALDNLAMVTALDNLAMITALDNLEMVTTQQPKRRKRLRRLHNKGIRKHFYRNSTRSSTPDVSSSSSGHDFAEYIATDNPIADGTELNAFITNSGTAEAIFNFTDGLRSPSKEPPVTDGEDTMEFAFGEKTSSAIRSRVASSGMSSTMQPLAPNSQPVTETQNETEQHTSGSNFTVSIFRFKRPSSLEAGSITKKTSSTAVGQSTSGIKKSTVNNQPVTERRESTVQSDSSGTFTTSEYGESFYRKAIENTMKSSTVEGQSLSKSEPVTEMKMPGGQDISSDSLTTLEYETSSSVQAFSSVIKSSTVNVPSVRGRQKSRQKSSSSGIFTTSEYQNASSLTVSTSTIKSSSIDGQSLSEMQKLTIRRQPVPEIQSSSEQYVSRDSLTTLENEKSTWLESDSTIMKLSSEDVHFVSEIKESIINSQPVTETHKSTEQYISNDSLTSSEYEKASSFERVPSIIKSSTVHDQNAPEIQEPRMKSQPATETQNITEQYTPRNSLTTLGILYKKLTSFEAVPNMSSTVSGQPLSEIQELTIKSQSLTEIQKSSDQYASSDSLTTLKTEKPSLKADLITMKSSTENAVSEIKESTVKNQPMTEAQNTNEQSTSNDSLTTLGILYKKLPTLDAVPNPKTSSKVGSQSLSEIDESTMRLNQPATETQESSDPSSSSNIFTTSEYEQYSSLKSITDTIEFSPVDGKSLSEIQELTVNQSATEAQESIAQHNLPTVMTAFASDSLITSEYTKLSSLEVDSTTMKSPINTIHSVSKESTVNSQPLTETQKSIEQYISEDNLTTSEYEKPSSLETNSSTVNSVTVDDHSERKIQKSTKRIQPVTETQKITEQLTSSNESLTSSVIQYRKLSPVDAVSRAETSSREGSQSSESEIQESTGNSRTVIKTAEEVDSSVELHNSTTEEVLKTGYIAEGAYVSADQNHPQLSLPSFKVENDDPTVVHPPDNVTSLKTLSLKLDPRWSQNSTQNLTDSKFSNLTISNVKHFTAKSSETEHTTEHEWLDGYLSRDHASKPLRRIIIFKEPLLTVADSVTIPSDGAEFSTHSNETEFLVTRKVGTAKMDGDNLPSTSASEDRFSLPMFTKTNNEKEEESNMSPHLTSVSMPEETSTKREGARIHVTFTDTATNYFVEADSRNHSLLGGLRYSMEEDPGKNSTGLWNEADLVTQSNLGRYPNPTTRVDNSSGPTVVAGFGRKSAQLDETSTAFPRQTFSGNTSDLLETRGGFASVLSSVPSIHPELVTGYRIVGGALESEPWPWMVSIYRAADMTFICGGALIEAQYVLSAAHCFTGPAFKMVASVGKLERIFDATQGTLVDLIVLHDGFEEDCYCNDLALLVLQSPAQATPIGVPMHDTALVGDATTLLGWGATAYREEGNVGTRSLQKLSHYPIHSSKHCRKIYSKLLNAELPVEFEKQTLCAGIENGSLDACLGDSGGPLMHQTRDNLWNLLGVVSFGYKCAVQGLYGTYTRISYYHDWIWKQVDAIEALRGQKQQRG